VAVAVAVSVSGSPQARAGVGREAPFEWDDGPTQEDSGRTRKNLAFFGKRMT